jgi:electron transfer flavoprotein alpha subunit
MSAVLVFVDRPVSGLGKPTRELLTLARRAGEPVVALAGEASTDVIAALASYGVSRIINSTQPELSEYLVAPKADFVARAADLTDARAVLVENSTEGKEIAARAGIALKAGVITDAIAVAADLTATKSVLAGSYTSTCQVRTPVAVISVKANSIEPAEAETPTEPAVEAVTVDFGPASLAVRIVNRQDKPASTRPDMSEARIVVAGGRGVNGDFTPVEELADVLGGAVGASRAATDAGWIEHSAQIGQTGKTVSPQLYISAGISGAIQQKAGMQTSAVIVAVNKDAESPVFEIADFGVVGDLFKVLPQAAEEIRRRRNS